MTNQSYYFSFTILTFSINAYDGILTWREKGSKVRIRHLLSLVNFGHNQGTLHLFLKVLKKNLSGESCWTQLMKFTHMPARKKRARQWIPFINCCFPWIWLAWIPNECSDGEFLHRPIPPSHGTEHLRPFAKSWMLIMTFLLSTSISGFWQNYTYSEPLFI